MRWRFFLVATMTAAALAACSGSGQHDAAPGPTPSQATRFSDLRYASASPMEVLDLYLPPSSAAPAPLLIWVHGGGWRTGDKSSILEPYDPGAPTPSPPNCTTIVQVQKPDLATLNAKGYAVAAIDYRLDQDPVHAVQDAKAAVRFLRANAARYHLDTDRFAVWGDSAGGYTAIMLGVTRGRQTEFDDPALGNAGVPATVQAVVDWFGPTDFAQIPGKLGPAESPFTYIKVGQPLPPFTIAQGDADCIVPVQSSRRLHDALTKAGDVATLAILHHANHEDPAFMRTQLTPTYAFLDRTFGR
jgi:acetyl esterase/lipase